MSARRRGYALTPRGQRRVNPHVTISEQAGVRYLHFGTEWVQGAMRVARPFALELEYQQQMMAPLLFMPRPARIVQLGLGAAALTKYCHRHLPEARLSVVELSAAVVEAARMWFSLPPDDARLAVHLQDARAFVADPAQRGCADWLQVDLYDAAARGPVHDDVPFYSACRRMLARPGVATFNLFGRSFEPSYCAISAAFEERVLVLPEADAGNRIAIAFNGPPLDWSWNELRLAARQAEARHRLPLRGWARAIEESGQFGTRFTI
jgi:spermidine synthase